MYKRHGFTGSISLKKKIKNNNLYFKRVTPITMKYSPWWPSVFYVSNWRRDRHFTWSSEPREGLAVCTAKGVTSLLSYFKTLSNGPALGIEPATSRSAVDTLYWLS